MTDFEVPQEVREAAAQSQHELNVGGLRAALNLVAVYQQKLDISNISLTNEPLAVTITYRQDGNQKTFGRVERVTHRFIENELPSRATSIEDEIKP